MGEFKRKKRSTKCFGR